LQALVKHSHAERHAREFRFWGRFEAILFCQLGCGQPLQGICGGLRSGKEKLAHFGISASSRSALAYGCLTDL